MEGCRIHVTHVCNLETRNDHRFSPLSSNSHNEWLHTNMVSRLSPFYFIFTQLIISNRLLISLLILTLNLVDLHETNINRCTMHVLMINIGLIVFMPLGVANKKKRKKKEGRNPKLSLRVAYVKSDLKILGASGATAERYSMMLMHAHG